MIDILEKIRSSLNEFCEKYQIRGFDVSLDPGPSLREELLEKLDILSYGVVIDDINIQIRGGGSCLIHFYIKPEDATATQLYELIRKLDAMVSIQEFPRKCFVLTIGGN